MNNIIVFNQELYTEKAEKTLKGMIAHIDPMPMAVVSDEVIFCDLNANNKDVDDILKKIKKSMRAVLRSHIDFSTVVCTDGYPMVLLSSQPGAVAVPEDCLEEGKIPFAAAYEAKCLAAEACKRCEVIALYIPEQV